MNPAEFLASRLALGLTQEALGRRLGYEGTGQSVRTLISRWETGKRPVPRMVALLLAQLSLPRPSA